MECGAYMARKRKLGLKIEGLKEEKIKEKYKRKEWRRRGADCY